MHIKANRLPWSGEAALFMLGLAAGLALIFSAGVFTPGEGVAIASPSVPEPLEREEFHPVWEILQVPPVDQPETLLEASIEVPNTPEDPDNQVQNTPENTGQKDQDPQEANDKPEVVRYGLAHIAPSPLRAPFSAPGGLGGEDEWFPPLIVPDNKAVERYVEVFKSAAGHRSFEKSLARSWAFVPIMRDILKSNGVAPDLVSVVMVESNFSHDARSSKSAAGFWQMLPSTARSLGLIVRGGVDERLDPLKSTRAAARYLRRLHDRFGDWELALAAYNCGETLLAGAIDKYKTQDFWELRARRALPAQTRHYVSKVLAAVKIRRNLEAYGFEKPALTPILALESVRVREPLRLRRVAEWAGISTKTLRELNPCLLGGRLPSGRDFILHLPEGSGRRFHLAYQEYLDEQAQGRDPFTIIW